MSLPVMMELEASRRRRLEVQVVTQPGGLQRASQVPAARAAMLPFWRSPLDSATLPLTATSASVSVSSTPRETSRVPSEGDAAHNPHPDDPLHRAPVIKFLDEERTLLASPRRPLVPESLAVKYQDDEGVVHDGFVCTACGMDPIRGPRFTCHECDPSVESGTVHFCERCSFDVKRFDYHKREYVEVANDADFEQTDEPLTAEEILRRRRRPATTKEHSLLVYRSATQKATKTATAKSRLWGVADTTIASVPEGASSDSVNGVSASLEEAARVIALGKLFTPAEALSQGDVPRTIPGTPARYPSRWTSGLSGTTVLDPLVELSIAEDATTVIPPLSETMRAAIDRLKVKATGGTEAVDEDIPFDERMRIQSENFAIGEELMKERADHLHGAPTVDALLLPDGINSIFWGDPAKFELTKSRFRQSMKLVECYLDDTRPMLVHPKFKIPVRIDPCRVRTGRYCSFAESCDPCREGTKSSLGTFGPGVSSYFKWMKGTMVLFFLLTIVAAPVLWLSANGTAYANESGGIGVALASLSLGTLGDTRNVTGCCIQTDAIVSWTWAGSANLSVAWFVTIFDCMLGVIFLLGWRSFRNQEKLDVEALESTRITLDDFSVEFYNLPGEVKASDVMDWINVQLLTADEERVVRVVVGLDLSRYLGISRARQALASRIEVIETELARLYVDAGATVLYDAKELARINRHVEKLEERKTEATREATVMKSAAEKKFRAMVELGEENAGLIALAQMEVNAAEAALAAAKELPTDTTESLRLKVSGTNAKASNLRKEHVLIAEVDLQKFGSSPADLRMHATATRLWELRRSLLSKAASLSERLKSHLKAPRVVKAWATFASTSLARSVLERTAISKWDILCCLSTVPRWRRMQGVHVVYTRAAPRPSSIVWENLNNAGGNVFKRLKGVVSALIVTVIVACSVAVSLMAFFMSKTLRGMGLTALAELPAPLLFAVVQLLTSFLVRFSSRHCERHQTRDALEYSTFIKLYFLYLANAALVICLFTADFSYLAPSTFGDLNALFENISSAFSGRVFFTDFTPAWHASVGSGIALFQFFNLLLPQVELCTCAIRISCLRVCVRKKLMTFSSQRALNIALRGPPFSIEDRGAHLLAALTVTLLFCTGIPLLVPICALVFLVAYWSELAGFASVYLAPPYMSSVVMQAILSISPIILIARCVFAIFFLTGPAFTPTPLRSGFANKSLILDGVSRMLQKYSIPNFLIIGATLVIVFWVQLRALVRVAMCWTDSRVCFSTRLKELLDEKPQAPPDLTIWELQESEALDHLRQNYREAFRSRTILDIPSFAIADNGAYFSAFGEIRAVRKYVDYEEPDPGPPERVLPYFEKDSQWKKLPFVMNRHPKDAYVAENIGSYDPGMDALANKPEFYESTVLHQVHEANSFEKIMKRVPPESVRHALYGRAGGLKSTEAVILKPKPVQESGEGRVGFVFKRLSRVHVVDDSHLPDLDAKAREKLNKKAQKKLVQSQK